jgi:hypothetical protein
MIIVLRTFKIYSRVQKNHHHCEQENKKQYRSWLLDVHVVYLGRYRNLGVQGKHRELLITMLLHWHDPSLVRGVAPNLNQYTQPAQYSEQGIRLTRSSRKKSPPLGQIKTANHKVIIYIYPLTYINMSSCQNNKIDIMDQNVDNSDICSYVT